VCSLVHLSLQKNEIQRIPHLLAVSDKYLVQDSGHRSASGRKSARKSVRRSARRQRQSFEERLVTSEIRVVGLKNDSEGSLSSAVPNSASAPEETRRMQSPVSSNDPGGFT
jgi:hypothetical protein